MNTLVETLKFENQESSSNDIWSLMQNVVNPAVLVEPQLPEGIDMKYEWATVDQNNVDTTAVTNGEEIFDHKRFLLNVRLIISFLLKHQLKKIG